MANDVYDGGSRLRTRDEGLMNNENNLVWIDGTFFTAKDANVSALSQTVHYGFGVYEGIRSYETHLGVAIFRLNEHIDRLFESAELLSLKIPYSRELLCQVHHQILEQSGLKNTYLRPVVYMGDEFLGLNTRRSSVHVMIAVIEWNHFYLTPEQIKRGISIKTSSHKRLALTNGLNKAKANGLYLISILANNEASDAGCHEALMLDPDGYIAECSGANIFMVKNNVLYTPFLNYALNGITRRSVIEIAQNKWFLVQEKNISPSELLNADEVFLTGTAAEVLAVTKIDGSVISTGEMGSITAQIKKTYNNITANKEANYRDWLSYPETEKLSLMTS